ncbi:inositol monophosphatase 1-like isoform X2 [Daphnia carinata]|uniref:inositol monophosphatase 1-like isoform X2 n=1 Tax=Daphnia carinata TaxID=120202 RepID=UPI00257E886E|nr:inositol monophosphatase 1-like isoform X2 [Daphnia carinata]
MPYGSITLHPVCQQIIKEAFYKKKSVLTKSCEVDLVTETDQAVEKMLIGRIKENFPNHMFIGEESVAAGEKCDLTNDPTWIVDPVDGTMNFVHSFPHSCISLAVLYHKDVHIGIIFNPILDQMYTAKRNQGAFLNDKPIRVSEEEDLSKSLVIAEFGTNRDTKKMESVLKNVSALMNKVHGLRAMGSAALNMASVAAGGADCYFEFGIHVWDIAAGALIIKEAGGICLDTEGGPLDLMSRRMICASSEKLALQIIPLLDQLKFERD